MASSCWESVSFARDREFEPGLRHKKRPHMEASSMLDKSFVQNRISGFGRRQVSMIGGPYRDRTDDLIVANDALSQLS